MFENPLELISPLGLIDELTFDAVINCTTGKTTTNTSTGTTVADCNTGKQSA